MSDIAIKVENLSKRYFIRHEKKESYETFQDVLINGGKKIITSLNPFDRSSANEDETVEEFWALKDVNFEINKGDKVGIIGRNGAGKSTLLKVLSRITEPTTGKIHINGRIASLLEVGTGFHPELTGRENIYLNGAILGMSRREIKSKFDEIVAFAEVEKFLDTPVKRYSSGMYVRLAFSVAAHLEPEILVVDEVLAVGDYDFQQKSLGKMDEVTKQGRTILFVSHNMEAIQKLCTKTIFLESGKIEYYGSTEDAIKIYLSLTQNNALKKNLSFLNRKQKKWGIDIKIDRFELYNSNMEKTDTFKFGEPFYIEISAIGLKGLKDLQFVIGINSKLGERITTAISAKVPSFNLSANKKANGIVKIHDVFVPSTYSLTLVILQQGKVVLDALYNIGIFKVDKIKDKSFINETYPGLGYQLMRSADWKIQSD